MTNNQTFFNINGSCPLGYICNPDLSEIASCLSIQNKAIWDFKFGDVLGGIYCAEGGKTIDNCDEGFYCPDPSTKLPCPAKYFCPHKTRVPAISCPACGEGSTTFARSLWGYILVIISLSATFIYILSNYLESRGSKQNQYSSKNSDDNIRQHLLNKVQPKIDSIQKKLERDDILVADHDGNLVFNDELLFENIDVDESGDLSYQELNSFLDLKPCQLLEFMSYMNELGSIPRGNPTVGKEVFECYFLEALEHSINFDPSDEKANELFDKLLSDLGSTSSSVIQIHRFHETCLSDFLDEFEILTLQKKFYRIFKIINYDDAEYRESSTRKSSISSLRRYENEISERPSRRAHPVSMDLTYAAESSEHFSQFEEIEKNIASKVEEYTFEKRTFVQCCLDALISSSSCDSSFTELEQTIIEIVENDVEGSIECSIDFDRLDKTGLSNYLEDSQISILAKKCKGVIDFKRQNFGSSSGDGSGSRVVRKMSSLLAVVPFFEGNSKKKELTRELFCQFYAIFLKEIKHNRGINQYINSDDNVNISFEHLSLHVSLRNNKKVVVDNVTGAVKEKSLTALMGGSGVGKTSLLNALCGRAHYGEMTGDIFINGQKSSVHDHKSIVGFVPQDDIVYPELTVKENFIFAGKFQLPAGTPSDAIVELAEETMANLGLTRVADSMVGSVNVRGVSGGERKRVNIGVELMSCPRILFLDEPTSGLDANSALLVMKSLRGLVDINHMTICSVIHQPRKMVFELFDAILLLGYGGKMVYHGPRSNIENYFLNLNYDLPVAENVADWVLDISSGSLDPKSELGDFVDSSRRRKSEQSDSQIEYGLHVAGKVSKAIQRSHTNSLNLSKYWAKHSKQENQFGESVKQKLPSARERPNFFQQLTTQVHRNMIVMCRQKKTKLTTMFSLLLIIIAICLLDGPVKATENNRPDISFEFEVLTSRNPGEFSSSFFGLFKYAYTGKQIPGFAMKIGVIISVVLGLAGGSNFNDKRLEFFREAASGYDVNAYYLALHITTLIEQQIMMLMTAIVTLWLRQSLSKGLSFILNFLLLDWVIIAWGLLFPLFVPPKNATIVIGLFMAFVGIQFSGQLEPLTFKKMYASDSISALVAFLCPIRYFVEQMGIIEQRALPAQSGFTHVQTGEAINFPRAMNSFNLIGTAQLDLDNVSVQSFYGWNWPILRVFMVGLTLRFFSFGFLHLFNRSFQNKKSLVSTLKANGSPKSWLLLIYALTTFCGLLVVTIYIVLN